MQNGKHVFDVYRLLPRKCLRGAPNPNNSAKQGEVEVQKVKSLESLEFTDPWQRCVKRSVPLETFLAMDRPLS